MHLYAMCIYIYMHTPIHPFVYVYASVALFIQLFSHLFTSNI